MSNWHLKLKKPKRTPVLPPKICFTCSYFCLTWDQVPPFSCSGQRSFLSSSLSVIPAASQPHWLSFKIYPESRLLIIFATTWGLPTLVLPEVRAVICQLILLLPLPRASLFSAWWPGWCFYYLCQIMTLLKPHQWPPIVTHSKAKSFLWPDGPFPFPSSLHTPLQHSGFLLFQGKEACPHLVSAPEVPSTSHFLSPDASLAKSFTTQPHALLVQSSLSQWEWEAQEPPFSILHWLLTLQPRASPRPLSSALLCPFSIMLITNCKSQMVKEWFR